MFLERLRVQKNSKLHLFQSFSLQIVLPWMTIRIQCNKVYHKKTSPRMDIIQRVIDIGKTYDSWCLHRIKLGYSDEEFAELLLRTWLESLNFQELPLNNEVISRTPNCKDDSAGAPLPIKTNTEKQVSDNQCLESTTKPFVIELGKLPSENKRCLASSQLKNTNSNSASHTEIEIQEKPSENEDSISLDNLSSNQIQSVPECIDSSTEVIIPNPINKVRHETQSGGEECIFEASYESIIEENFSNETTTFVPTVNSDSNPLPVIVKTEPDDFSINDCQYSTESLSLLSLEYRQHEPCTSNNSYTSNQEGFTVETEEYISSEPDDYLGTLTGEKPHSCDFCNKSFADKPKLWRHQKTHTEEKPFKCDYCDLTFKWKSTLTKHTMIHTGDKPFKCHVCNKEFCQKSNLSTHMQDHTGENLFKCSMCDKTLKTKHRLSEHMLLHSGSKPFKCNFCTKAFATKSRLTRHQTIHTGERPYKCMLCDKAFLESSSLMTHLRSHTKEKPYNCDFCDKSFVYKSSLNSHVKIHT